MAKQKKEETPKAAEPEVELVETEEVVPKKKREPKRQAKGMFWKNPTHFHVFGTVTGEVTAEQEIEFNRVTPKETAIKNWIMDHDPIAKRQDEAKARMKKRAGLDGLTE